MPRLASYLVTLLVVIAVAGCTSEPAPAPAPFGVPTTPGAEEALPTTTAVVPVLTPEQEELFGPRVELPGGLLQKQIGKVAQYGGPDDEDPNTWGVRVVVDSIEVDPKCDEYTPKPTRGHRLLVTLRVETSDGFDAQRDGTPGYYQWSTIGPDDVTEAAMTSYYPCRQAAELPNELRKEAKYRGTVAVDTSNTSGQVVLSDFAAWRYPT